MGKYIDAEKLRAEINSIIEVAKKEMRDSGIDPYSDSPSEERAYAKINSVIETCETIIDIIDSLQQKQPEVDLEHFTQKMEDWKARYNHPDNIPIKATMAFTARMFYQYPNIARQWYDSLPKATQD